MNTNPRETETLLLQAAVGDAAMALPAWRTWRDRLDFDDVTGESVRIVPLLFRNLGRLGVPAAEIVRYASVYRHHWAANRLAFLSGAKALRHMQDAGIETLLLKGAALTVLHYKDVGVRAMGDVDFLVPRARAMDAARLLERHGWVRTPDSPRVVDEAYTTITHSAGYQDDKGRQIDLHWYASAEARWPGVDDALWETSVPVVFEGVATRALGPTHLLYNVIAHGYSSFAEHIRWAVDAATILKDARAGDIDWHRFVAMCTSRRLVLPALLQLRWLRDVLAAPVPESVIAALVATKVSAVDRAEYRHLLADDPFTLDKVLLRHWCWYRRSTDARGASLLAGFPRHLAAYYAAPDLAGLARTLVARGQRRWRHFKAR